MLDVMLLESGEFKVTTFDSRLTEETCLTLGYVNLSTVTDVGTVTDVLADMTPPIDVAIRS
jgi:hypothetical protein